MLEERFKERHSQPCKSNDDLVSDPSGNCFPCEVRMSEVEVLQPVFEPRIGDHGSGGGGGCGGRGHGQDQSA